MLETGSHIYKLYLIFPKQFKMKKNKIKLEKAICQPPGRSVVLQYALDRPRGALSSHTKVYGSDIRPNQPSFVLHRSLRRTPGAVLILFQFTSLPFKD